MLSRARTKSKKQALLQVFGKSLCSWSIPTFVKIVFRNLEKSFNTKYTSLLVPHQHRNVGSPSRILIDTAILGVSDGSTRWVFEGCEASWFGSSAISRSDPKTTTCHIFNFNSLLASLCFKEKYYDCTSWFISLAFLAFVFAPLQKEKHLHGVLPGPLPGILGEGRRDLWWSVWHLEKFIPVWECFFLRTEELLIKCNHWTDLEMFNDVWLEIAS